MGDTRFKKNNVPWNKGIKNPGIGGRKKLEWDVERAKKLYLKDKLSCLQLEEIFGVSRNTIARRLDDLGLRRRTRSELSSIVMQRPGVKKLFAKIYKDRWDRPGEREKMSVRMLNLYKDEQWKITIVKKSRKAQSHKKTKPERQVGKLLEDTNFEFVGNGAVHIGHFIPDFIDKKNNLIIEVYGDYWHNLPRYVDADKRRLVTYKKLGFRTLIIWEHELKDLRVVKQKIKEFIL